jgi:hypothetical protein
MNQHNCLLLREGGNHSIFKNVTSGKRTSVPRHNEIDRQLARDICDQLEIPRPE